MNINTKPFRVLARAAMLIGFVLGSLVFPATSRAQIQVDFDSSYNLPLPTAISASALSANGAFFATGNQAGNVTIYDVAGKRSLLSKQVDGAGIASLQFAPSGTLLAVAGATGQVRVLQRVDAAWEDRLTLPQRAEKPAVMAFSRSGNLLAVGNATGDVTVMSGITEGNPALLWTFKAHNKAIYTVVFHPDENVIVTIGSDRKIKWWNAGQKSLIRTVPIELKNLEGMRSATSSLHGKRIAIGLRFQHIVGDFSDITWKEWILLLNEKGDQVKYMKGQGNYVDTTLALAMSPNGQITVSPAAKTKQNPSPGLRIWDVDRGYDVQPRLEGVSGLKALQLGGNPNGYWVAATGKEEIKFYRLRRAGTDNFPPDIEIVEPVVKQGARRVAIRPKAGGDSFLISGIARDNVGVDQVLVNGKPAKLKSPAGSTKVEFEYALEASAAAGQAEIIALDTAQNQGRKVLAFEGPGEPGKNYDVVNRWAVVIGINDYAKLSPDQDLRFCENDARLVHKLLSDPQVGKFPAGNIKLLLGTEATKSNITSAMEWLNKNARRDDLVVIYFSGHGGYDETPSEDQDSMSKYVMPFDVNPDNIYATGLPTDQWQRWLLLLPSERVVVAFDCCFAGGIVPTGLERRPTLSAESLDDVSAGRGRVMLLASDPNQTSKECPLLKHGVFTYYLVEGLRGKADKDKDKKVSVNEAYSYLYEKVLKADAECLTGGIQQAPLIWSDLIGELYLSFPKS